MADDQSTVQSVFISYTGADHHLVQAIRDGLEKAGTAGCFTFEHDILLGHNIVEEVRSRLSNCTHFLCIVTKESLNRPWIRHEINTALLRYLQGQCSILLVSRELDDDDLPWDMRQFDHLKVVDEGTAVSEIVHAVAGLRRPKPRQRWDFWRKFPQKPDVFKLLSWHVRLTQLYGRKGELDALLSWACDEADEPRIRVVTGPGGVGKTRLAAELCDSLWHVGWEVDFLDLRKNVSPTGLGTLWVVDYPEERQRELGDFLRSLKSRRTGSIPVRVLMLSRQPEEWWAGNNEIKQAHATHLFDTFDLKLVGLGAQDTVTMFREACSNLCESYKRALPQVADDDIINWRQKAEFHTTPLMIVAAALHAVLDPDEALGLMGREVVWSLVKRERARLDGIGEETAKLMGYGRDRVEPTWASRLYGLSAASSGIDADLLRALAQPELELGLPEPGRVVEVARRLPIFSSQIDPPQIDVPRPDIFGAALLYDVLSDRSDKAPDWLWTAFHLGKNSANEELADRLGRLIYDVSIVSAGKDKRFRNWLLEMIRSNPERAHFLEPLGKEERPPDAVLPLTIEVNKHLAAENGDDPLLRAERLTLLSLHLTRADRDTEAVDPARKAVEILRNCSTAGTDCRRQESRALRVLAMALSNQATSSQAVAVGKEAVVLARSLVDSANGRDDLAKALNTLGIALRTMGQAEESLKALEETVAIYRELRKTNETADRRMVLMDSLARGLFNLSLDYWNLGQKTDALAAIDESVSIRRDLHAESPWRYGRYFALSLSQLASFLAETGEYDRAIETINQAITIRRRLMAANPGQFGIDLVTALSSKASILTVAGRQEDATSTYEEETKTLHELMDDGALTADNSTLADLTMTLAGIIGYNAVEAGRPEAAIDACSKVVDLIERVRREKWEQWGPNLQLNLMAAYLNRGNAHRKTSEGRKSAIADYTEAIEEGEGLSRLPDREPSWIVYIQVALLNRCLERLADGDDTGLEDYRRTQGLELDLRNELGEAWPVPEHRQLLKSLKILASRLKERKNHELLVEVAEQLSDLAIALTKNQKGTVDDATMQIARDVMNVGDALLTAAKPDAAIPLISHGINLVEAVLNQPPRSLDKTARASFLNDVGYVCAELADHCRSRDYATKSERWLREAMALVDPMEVSDLSGQLNDSLGFALAVRAELDSEAGTASEAQSLLQRSLDIFVELKSDAQAGTVREHIARFHAIFTH